MTTNGHETRYSDSSLYDEVCVNCGATDAPDGGLDRGCLKPVGRGGITIMEWHDRRDQRVKAQPGVEGKEAYVLTGEDVEVLRKVVAEFRAQPIRPLPEDESVRVVRINYQAASDAAQLAGGLANCGALIQAAGAILAAWYGAGNASATVTSPVVEWASKYLAAQFQDGIETREADDADRVG